MEAQQTVFELLSMCVYIGIKSRFHLSPTFHLKDTSFIITQRCVTASVTLEVIYDLKCQEKNVEWPRASGLPAPQLNFETRP